MRRKPARAWKSSRLGASSWKLSIKVEAGRLAKGAAMAMKIRWSRPAGRHPMRTLLLRIALLTVAAVALVCFSIFGYFYFKYQHVVDQRLKQPIFANTARSEERRVGQERRS